MGWVRGEGCQNERVTGPLGEAARVDSWAGVERGIGPEAEGWGEPRCHPKWWEHRGDTRGEKRKEPILSLIFTQMRSPVSVEHPPPTGEASSVPCTVPCFIPPKP